MAGRALTAGVVACLGLGAADLAYLNMELVPAAVAPPAPEVAESPPPAPRQVAIPAPAARPASVSPLPDGARVYFPENRATLGPRSREQLDAVADRLEADDSLAVLVEGHTNRRGPDDVNDRLSERRANRVAAYLRERGVAGERIDVEFYGKRRPLVDGRSREARRRNRRAEITYRRPSP